MTNKFAARLFCVGALSALIFIGGFKAYATEGEKKNLVDTICCKNGGHTGNSNDCTASTTGACVDHNCNAGSTEETGLPCPQ